MRPTWPKKACFAQKTCSLYTFNSLVFYSLPKDILLKSMFPFVQSKDYQYIFIVSSQDILKYG